MSDRTVPVSRRTSRVRWISAYFLASPAPIERVFWIIRRLRAEDEVGSLGMSFQLSSITNIFDLGWVKETGSRGIDVTVAWLNLKEFVGLHRAGWKMWQELRY